MVTEEAEEAVTCFFLKLAVPVRMALMVLAGRVALALFMVVFLVVALVVCLEMVEVVMEGGLAVAGEVVDRMADIPSQVVMAPAVK